MELNKIYNEDCLVTLGKMPNEFLDFTLTSPPYDGIRNYQGFSFDFASVSKEIFRTTKSGGVVAWIVGDQTVKGSETGTSFKQALGFMEVGFRLHDTMIYQKSGWNFPANNRYHQTFEYIFIFSKGSPKTFNPIKDRPNRYPGQKAHGMHRGKNENEYVDMSQIVKAKPVGEFGMRTNVWYVKVGGGNVTKDKIAYKHPAIFPESLANDLIISWSNEGEICYDPFMGSATTAKMALKNKRIYLGSEISADYCQIAEERLKLCQT
jgi:DNA modification methylase